MALSTQFQFPQSFAYQAYPLLHSWMHKSKICSWAEQSEMVFQKKKEICKALLVHIAYSFFVPNSYLGYSPSKNKRMFFRGFYAICKTATTGHKATYSIIRQKTLLRGLSIRATGLSWAVLLPTWGWMTYARLQVMSYSINQNYIGM